MEGCALCVVKVIFQHEYYYVVYSVWIFQYGWYGLFMEVCALCVVVKVIFQYTSLVALK